MNNLLLFSVSSNISVRNFSKVVLEGISEGSIKQYNLDKYIQGSEGYKKFHCWGIREGRYYQNKFSRINKGDIILFARNKVFIIMATISDTIKNRELSQYLFNDNSYSYILILSNITPISISYGKLFRILNYHPKAKMNGLVFVNQQRLHNLTNSPDGLKGFLSIISDD